MYNRIFKRLIADEDGQAMTEYVLIIALIVIVCIVVVRLFGKQIRDLFIKAAKEISE